MKAFRSLVVLLALLAGGEVGAQPADPLCIKYQNVDLATLNGQVVRLDCAGVQALAGAFGPPLTPQMKLLAETFTQLAAAEALRTMPADQAIGAMDPILAQRCYTMGTERRRYVCDVMPQASFYFPLRDDGRAASINTDWDLELILRPTGMTNIRDAFYQFLLDVIGAINAQAAQPLPMRLDGRVLLITRPVEP